MRTRGAQRPGRGVASALLGLATCLAEPAHADTPPRRVPAAAVGLEPAATDSGALLRAYHAALQGRRLDASGALSVERLRELLASAERQIALGRRDEAISVLAALVESPRFAPLRDLPEGRVATFLLADCLGRVGAYRDALSYFERLLGAKEVDVALRRAATSMVELGLQSGAGEEFLALLSRLPAGEAQPWAGDVAFLRGVLHERAGRARQALVEYGSVLARSRYWAQATYRAGLIEVERRELEAGERNFCRIADPKQTPKQAPLLGGTQFFEVRDLARLALGRVAHEQYRFDDARYYYHLVPGDSDRLPEALYESATSRYEAKDYERARELLDELRALERPHVYADEAWILEAYVELAQCRFPEADARLQEFARRYEPVLAAARQLQADSSALAALLEGGAAHATGTGLSADVSELLLSSIRMDPGYEAVTRRLRDLERQLGGLASARLGLAALESAAADPGAVKPRQSSSALNAAPEGSQRVGEQAAAIRRLLREASRQPGADGSQISPLERELASIEAAAAALEAGSTPELAASPDARQQEDSLSELIRQDLALTSEVEQRGRALRRTLRREQRTQAAQAVARLEQRLTRLVRRGRAARIETVLGRKRAVEIEIEALSQGMLPPGAVDSLDAARYLQDDEEYWPFDGEDWEDEYIGGEGLR